MKALALAAAFAALGATAQGDALPKSTAAITQGSQICLRADRIRGRTIVDKQTIVFRMNDGTYWKNTLQNACVGLRIADGFAFVAHDDYICSNQQRIRVLGQGTICFMGDFSPTMSPVKPASAQ